MSRRTLKRVDYSKFSTSGPSDSEDDFQDSPPPATSKKVKKSKENIVEKKKGNKNTNAAVSKRTTRTSNADNEYEQDLLTAIKVSSKCEIPSTNDSRQRNHITKKEKTDVINVSDSEEEVVKLLKKKKKNCLLEDSFEEVISVSKLSDTLPLPKKMISDAAEENDLKDNIELDAAPKGKNIKSLKRNNETRKNKENDNRSTMSPCVEHLNNADINPKKTPTLQPTENSLAISNNNGSSKVLTPGRLRIGLSRNMRIAKPLHSNVNPNL